MSRILIDGRFIGVGESMTRYCLELVRGILTLDKENSYSLLIRPAGIEPLKKFFNDEIIMAKPEQSQNVQKIESFIRHSSFGFRNLAVDILDIPHYSLAEQTKLLDYLNEQKYDLVHFIQFNHPVRYGGKFVVSIHDLTLIGHLHRQRFYKRLAFGQVMKSAAKNSAKIITISDTSKQEIMEYYGVPENKIDVTYLAVDQKYQPASKLSDFDSRISDFRQKYHINGDYLLYTGMWKRHKNILRMIEAFGKFSLESNSNIQLVLVGKIDSNEPEVMKLINKINEKIIKTIHPEEPRDLPNKLEDSSQNVQNDNLFDSKKLEHNSSFVIRHSDRPKPILTTGFVEEDELPIAYAGALAYVIPSLSEGFGLPPLEAMACGTPVISSNASAMPEILGDAALYFDPYKVDDIARAMKDVVSDQELRDSLSQKGLAQAAKFSWDDTAKKTLEVYKEVLKGK